LPSKRLEQPDDRPIRDADAFNCRDGEVTSAPKYNVQSTSHPRRESIAARLTPADLTVRHVRTP
jgi:hypothetical protein